MARDFAARAQAAEDPETANDLARSYQRMARSYRQSLALKVRLGREMAAAERETAAHPPPSNPRAARRRIDELRGAVARVAFAEYEGPEREGEIADTLDLLEDVLLDYASEADVARPPLDEQVAEICEELGLSSALAGRWRDLPEPSDEPFAEPQEPPGWPARRESG
jgi:hypothetical protein